MTAPTTDDRGYVLWPPAHDARLTGLRCENGTARLELKGEVGERYELVLSGVRRLRATDFLEGNIVDAIRVVPQPDIEILAFIYDETGHREYLNELYSSWCEGNIKVIELNSSYGCYCAAIYTDFEWCRKDSPE